MLIKFVLRFLFCILWVFFFFLARLRDSSNYRISITVTRYIIPYPSVHIKCVENAFECHDFFIISQTYRQVSTVIHIR